MAPPAVLDALGRLGAEYLIYLLLLLIAGVGLAEFRRDWPSGMRMAATGVVSVALALGAAITLSQLWYEARPFATDPTTHLLISHSLDSGFPSDHVAVAAAAVTVAAGWHPDLVPVFAATNIVIALSRVFVGVHYPGDVAAGAMLGAAIGIGVRAATSRIVRGHSVPQYQ